METERGQVDRRNAYVNIYRHKAHRPLGRRKLAPLVEPSVRILCLSSIYPPGAPPSTMVGPSSRSTVHFLLFALLHVATTCWAACQLTPYYTAYYPNDLNVVITKNYVSTDTEREGSGVRLSLPWERG